MKTSPRISVIMNCYNGDRYLREAIDSVLSQTFTDWEIIFWDNQSTDRSAEIFNSYNDPRLHYYFAPTHTLLYDARNYAINVAKGEFIAFLDVDDWWLPDKLQKQLDLFSDPAIGLVCANYIVVNQNKQKSWKAFRKPVPTGYVLNELLKNYYVALLTLMVRKSALDELPYLCDPGYHIIGDFDLVIRLMEKWKLGCVQKPLACYRIHGSNETLRQHHRQINEMERWVNEMSSVESVSRCKNFNYVSAHIIYISAINKIVNFNKIDAFYALKELPFGVYKLRLLLALLLPNHLLRKFKN